MYTYVTILVSYSDDEKQRSKGERHKKYFSSKIDDRPISKARKQTRLIFLHFLYMLQAAEKK